jgi:hypothetical protein
VINRPDPCIYSQFLLMQLGQPVTWDNPDVAIFLGGVEQYTYSLTVDTAYDVAITVHNSSREKPAPGTQVQVRWIEFGAGGQIRHPIATLVADVPVWPGTTTVHTGWKTPATPGHYCIEVELSHPDDGNPANNRGWNNTQVKAAASTMTTPIRIFNLWPDGCPRAVQGGFTASALRAFFWWGLLGAALALTFGNAEFHRPSTMLAAWAVGGYVGGLLLGLALELLVARIRNQPGRAGATTEREAARCRTVEITVDGYRFVDGSGKAVDPATMFAPRPPAWPAHVDPSLFQFAENELYHDVNLVVDAPNQTGLQEVFNVGVRQGGTPAGGVTVTVTT